MYKTGNPVPSSALEDMADNAQTFDALVTKTEGTTTDRLGRTRRVFQQILMDMGFSPVSGSFQAGATITEYNQCLLDTSTGTFYSWGGALPKVAPAGSTPATAGGIGPLLWVDRTDLTLRAEIMPSVFNSLKQLANDSGFNLVDGSFEYGGTVSAANDVLLYKKTGGYYSLNSGGALTVPAGSFPDGNWTSKSGIKLKTTETASVAALPSGAVAKSGYTYNVNGELAQSTGADYGHRLDAISKLNRHLGFLQQSQTRAYAAWASQVKYSDQFANLSGWAGSSPTVLQVSGGAVFANGAGANSGMCHGISAASSKFRCVTTVNYVSSSNPDGVAIGISSASPGAAPATGLADCFAIYLSKNGMKQILNGVITAHENENPLVTGVYVITVSQDDNFTSIVAKLAGGGANTEYAIRISRGTVAANNIVIFNSDVRLLSGHSIGPLAVGVGSTATLQQTGIVDGQYPTVVWTGGANADFRILTPTGYDSRNPRPAVLLFHGLGSTEKTWSSNANYFAISNALSSAGYIVISAARRGEYGTWGNVNAQAAYSEAYRYLILNYNINCIACLANSMGGIEFFNSLASASVGVPVCFVGTSTTANLASCFASPSLTESIKSAYGIAADGSNYAVKTAGYDRDGRRGR